jgi:hypothetical protein
LGGSVRRDRARARSRSRPALLIHSVGTAGSQQHTPLLLGTTLTANMPTLLDLASRLDGNNRIAQIVEVMNQFNEILDDAVAVEANSLTGHKTVIRTGIPGATWRKLYGGVQPAKSTTTPVTDSFGMLENYAKIDKALVDIAPDGMAYRLTEAQPILEGMAQEVAQTLLYGNEKSAPEEFTGLAARYNSLTAENGVDNIVNGGGVGSDNTSIWLCGWGPNTGHLIFPKGSKAGVQQEDKGQITIQNSDGSMFEAYVEHFRWDIGVSVRDWRYFVRIANIDVSDLGTLANTKNLVQFMTMASERIPSFSGARFAWYLNRNTREKLRLGIVEKIAPASLTWETVAGKRVMMFDGIPVRRVDQILNTEAQIT